MKLNCSPNKVWITLERANERLGLADVFYRHFVQEYITLIQFYENCKSLKDARFRAWQTELLEPLLRIQGMYEKIISEGLNNNLKQLIDAGIPVNYAFSRPPSFKPETAKYSIYNREHFQNHIVLEFNGNGYYYFLRATANPRTLPSHVPWLAGTIDIQCIDRMNFIDPDIRAWASGFMARYQQVLAKTINKY